jgi:transketolase
MSRAAISDPDRLAIATLRTLCIDAVHRANSGHPGTPMAMAPVAYTYTLWQRFLRFDPDDAVVGMDTFGASAPLKELQTRFGFTPEAVVGIAKARLAASAGG